ncbi:phosphoserine phosphatase SerB [Rothia sp. LK2588]|uniref:phosphoserine phosphatase SerB n=1 Tax=Rothia sp. LK2588 TaxID=3114369 RepID=UPI0034D0052F
MDTSVTVVGLSTSDSVSASVINDVPRILDQVGLLTLDEHSVVRSGPRHRTYEAVGPGYATYLGVGTYRGSLESLRRQLRNLAESHGFDGTLSAVETMVDPQQPRLVVFDTDSTLITQEVIDELARYAGREHEVAEVTEAAMSGEIDFETSLRRRVKALAGLPVSVFDEVVQNITFTAGAYELVRALHDRGHTVATVSGGFMEILEPLADLIGLDHARANRLEVAGGKLTGDLRGPVITPEVKRETLQEWATLAGISLVDTVAIGDGANDVLMVKDAGLGVAFRAKDPLRQVADAEVNVARLDAVRHLLGV